MVSVVQVVELFSYNAWANRKVFSALAALSAKDYTQDLRSSFASLHDTMAHIVWAEDLWLRRWRGAPPPPVPQGRDLTTLDAVRARWEEVEASRLAFLAALTDAALETALVVRPSAGGEYRHVLRETLLHAVDHSSYHRGQLVTMLRQLGHVPPVTGLITFYRERRPA
jgi:uncharacterized damage-inducible protein DinB